MKGNMVKEEQTAITILGVGNILCADEGFGVRVAERLYAEYDFPAGVEVVDGGTQGPMLLQFVERSKKLLIADAVDFGLAPGTLTKKEKADIPVWLSARKMSVHQNNFSEVLALARLREAMPEEIVLIGLQPIDLTFGASLTKTAKARLREAADLILAQLAAWGIRPEKAKTAKCLINQPVSLDRYEAHSGHRCPPEVSVFPRSL